MLGKRGRKRRGKTRVVYVLAGGEGFGGEDNYRVIWEGGNDLFTAIRFFAFSPFFAARSFSKRKCFFVVNIVFGVIRFSSLEDFPPHPQFVLIAE